MNANRKAFLDMIAWSEIGPKLLAQSSNGYNVLVGGELFSDYSAHPKKSVRLERLGINSTAAGRYQLLYRYWIAYSRLLNLPDFSPASQDAIALQQIRECRALDDIDAGRFDEAVRKCSRIWASLPCAGYGQHENGLDDLRAAYVAAGGALTTAEVA